MNTNIDTANLRKYINDCKDELKNLLIDLCKIPAPPHLEQGRASFCEKWFKEHCTKNVHTDSALNVICEYGDENAREIIVFMAHMDTVFPDTEPMPMREENDRLYCPGVGDDTANLAILMLCARYIFKTRPNTKYKILFVANSCEEGLGNLKGSRELLSTYGECVRAVISFDLDTSTLICRAVGSHRYGIKISTKGGHSYFDFGNDNAIQIASSIISELYAQSAPMDATYNVGTISGGTSVNTIAQSCEFTYEYRCELESSLELMKSKFEKIIQKYVSAGFDIKVECIGKRPGMGKLKSPSEQEALVALAEGIYEKLLGAIPVREAGSTDCNIPLSMGINSVCLGLINMSGAHTRSEYVELDSLPKGLEIAVNTVVSVCSVDFDKFCENS